MTNRYKSCHPMEFTKARRLADTARNETTLLQNKHTRIKQTTEVCLQKPKFKNLWRRKKSSKVCPKNADLFGIFVFSDSLGTGQEGHHKFGTQKLRVHNSTSMKIYQNSVINYENLVPKFHENSRKSFELHSVSIGNTSTHMFRCPC